MTVAARSTSEAGRCRRRGRARGRRRWRARCCGSSSSSTTSPAPLRWSCSCGQLYQIQRLAGRLRLPSPWSWSWLVTCGGLFQGIVHRLPTNWRPGFAGAAAVANSAAVRSGFRVSGRSSELTATCATRPSIGNSGLARQGHIRHPALRYQRGSALD